MKNIRILFIELMLILALFSIGIVNADDSNIEGYDQVSLSDIDVSDMTFEERMVTLSNLKMSLAEKERDYQERSILAEDGSFMPETASVQSDIELSSISDEQSSYTFTLNGNAEILWSYENTEMYEEVVVDISDDVNDDGIFDVVIFDNDMLTMRSGKDGSIIWQKYYGYISSVMTLYDDLNSDGVAELIICYEDHNSENQVTVFVEILSGESGDVWKDNSFDITRDSSYLYVYPYFNYDFSDLNGDGTDDVILYLYCDYETEINGEYEYEYETTLIALDSSTCFKIWENTFEGDVEVTTTDFTGDGVNDLIFYSYDYEYDDDTWTYTDYYTLHLVNGYDGTPFFSYSTIDSWFTYEIVDDCDGDGLPDIILAINGNPTQLRMLKGTNGAEIWSNTYSSNLCDILAIGQDIVIGTESEVILLSSVDGSVIWTSACDYEYYWFSTGYVNDDTVEDIYMFTDEYSYDYSLYEFSINTLDGSNGNPIWEYDGFYDDSGDVFLGADINGDNKDDVFITSLDSVDTTDYIVNLKVLSGADGSQCWYESYPLSIDISIDETDDNLYVGVYSWVDSVSDLNGDSVIDPTIEIEYYFNWYDESTYEWIYYEGGIFSAVDGNNGNELWNAQYSSDDWVYAQLVGWLDCNSDNIDDIFLATTKGVYAIVATSSTGGQAPVASFYADATSGVTPIEVQFTDSSSGNPTSWSWDFGDGATSTEQNPAHTYDVAGNYSVILDVSNNYGSDSITKTNYIKVIEPNEEPVASITSVSPNPATEGVSVSFSGSGTDNDGTVTGYYWTSSIDGYLSSSSSFSTSALSAGTHTIYFKVQDDDGEWSDIVSASLTINSESSSSDSSSGAGNAYLDIRSPVYTGPCTFTAANFAGFWYDIDDDIASEVMEISEINDRTIPAEALRYSATIQQTEYSADFAAEAIGSYQYTYPVIGLFAEKYVPTDDSDAGELVKLLLDTDNKYTLRTGSALELADGYELTAKQIDVEGTKVWMELSKDGEFVEDEVIDVSGGEVTWTYDVDIGNTDDVIVFRVLVTDIFQGQVDSLVVVEGLYLIDFENVLYIDVGDEFGELEVNSISTSVEMLNSAPIILSVDSIVDLAENLKFRVADDNALRFYLMEECTESGLYTIRGELATAENIWTPANFAGFWYDINDDIGSEQLAVTEISGRVIPEGTLRYNATIVQNEYAANFAAEGAGYQYTYPLIGFLGEDYVSVSDSAPDELVKLLVDNDNKYTLRTGSALELAGGYELTAKQIDVEGDKVWMELSKDGEFIEDAVIDVLSGEATWTYDTDVGNTDDVIVFRLLVTDVFQGQVDSLVVVEGLYLIDYENVIYIDAGDEFGELEVDSISSSTIEMYNIGTIILSIGDTVDIAEGLSFKVADDDLSLRYYPFVEKYYYESSSASENNEEPVASITSVSPNPATEGVSVSFSGSGTDNDGTVTGYYWTSSIDGYLSSSSSFSTSALSAGTHTIYFKVQDDDGEWSDIVSASLTIYEISNEAPTANITSILPNPTIEGTLVSFVGNGVDNDGTIIGYNWRSTIDGQLSTSAEFSTSALSVGTHTIYFKVQDDDGAWSPEVSGTIIVDDGAPFVNISVGFDSNISVNNPVDIILNSSDMYPGVTEFIIMNGSGNTVFTKNMTEYISTDDYLLTWNATNQTGESVPSGTYYLNLTSFDLYGHFSSKEVPVVVDNTIPSIEINSISGSNTVDKMVYANLELSVNVSVSGTPGNPSSVDVILSSNFSNFEITSSAFNEDGNWIGYFNLSSIPDDGEYYVTVVAEDGAKNTNSTISDIVVNIDRVSPCLYSSISMIDDSHAYVNVSSSESLESIPAVTVNRNSVNMEANGDYWSGIFELDTSNVYNINVIGQDMAGNQAIAETDSHITLVEVSEGKGSFESGSGLKINFTANGTFNDTIIVSESTSPFLELSSGYIGLCILDVHLGSDMSDNLFNATISIPVNISIIPEGMTADDVSICYFNESTGIWEIYDTIVDTIDDTDYWVATVDHFSIYAALGIDSVAPVLGSVTPSEGTPFVEGTTSVDIHFTYGDDCTGINFNSIIFSVDGVDLTDSATVTTSGVSYTASGLSAGSHSTSVYVTDNAGNPSLFSTSFTIASGSTTYTTNPSSGGGGGGGGTTGEAYENILVKDVISIFINKDSHVNYVFTEEGNSITSVQFDSLKNSGTISTIVEVLKDRSSFADVDAPGTIYQQMNIWVGKSGFVTPENVENLLITFKVEKSWLEENNIEASTVYLYRYSDGSWNALPTSITGEDDEFVYLESETPGFSPFAIGSEAEATEIVEEDSLMSVEDTTVENNANKEAPESSSSSTGILAILGGISVLLVGAFIVYKKRS
ncbi:S-layer protein domain-containing protein [Methanolobus sediminis]|uniref:S-layer protein domain-containing protein n=1 Tax=Methanolobus sediminis TaxID=3072978 RepID=A0AA51UMB3_9EURY|nr:S-layer protein domain-containing protein [Methanolobus sediminis]WMW26243.1 S-layer protein domain-containing protein [Methanolobus sediminis]